MFGFRLLILLTLNVKPVSIQKYSFYLKSIKSKFEMPEIFKWKLIGRYVSGSPLLDITAYFRAMVQCEGMGLGLKGWCSQNESAK